MRRIYLFLLILLATSCSQNLDFEESQASQNGSTRFTISNYGGEIEESTRSSERPIGQLIFAIFDSQDRLVRHAHQQLSPDLTSLTVEGLRDGNYTIIMLGAGDKSAPLLIGELTSKTQKWIGDSPTAKPLDYDYLYKSQPFEVNTESSSRCVPIQLERSVGRVKVELEAINPYSKIYITKVEVSYEADSGVATHQLANGTYIGENIIRDFDITKSLEFYSLPSAKKLSGSVRVTALRSDGSIFADTYKFRDAEIVAGKESVIHIKWSHPEDKLGSFKIRKQDLNSSNSTTIFYDGEDRNAIVGEGRGYNVNNPLQLSIDANHKLAMRFFSAIPIDNVTILCQFSKVSNEYFELAHFEHIPAFHESHMSIPVVSNSAIFKSEDGRLVEIPAQPNLGNNDCRLIFKTEDPYMKKIATIESKWFVYFWHFNAAEDPESSWKFMTPELCRQGVVLTTNMAYMFSSKEFKDLMTLHNLELHDDQRVPIPCTEIFRRINAVGKLRMGTVSGYQGLGGGETYGLADYRYRDHYWDVMGRDEIRTTQFHEFSHCLGWSHNSDMTYGSGMWNKWCSQLMWDMGYEGKLPVNTKKVLNP